MNNEEDPVLTIKLPVSTVNVILAGLQELPFKMADPVMKNLIQQAETQLSAQAAPAAGEAETEE